MLLPAFGSPIKPISAINFSRSQIHFSSNGPPGCAFLGAWLTDVLKKLNIDNVINISSVSGENITYLIRELQNFIVKMKNKENSKNQAKKIISWSP